MTDRSRTLVTLLVLLLVLALGLLWGWKAITKPFPGRVEQAACVSTKVNRGDKVFPQDLLVNVLNAGDRDGLAGATMKQLKQVGFAPGRTGNAPTRVKVSKAQVWASHPKGPGAQLLASWLGPGTDVRHRGGKYDGLVVVVGDDFDQLAKGHKFLKASGASTVCSPPL